MASSPAPAQRPTTPLPTPTGSASHSSSLGWPPPRRAPTGTLGCLMVSANRSASSFLRASSAAFLSCRRGDGSAARLSCGWRRAARLPRGRPSPGSAAARQVAAATCAGLSVCSHRGPATGCPRTRHHAQGGHAHDPRTLRLGSSRRGFFCGCALFCSCCTYFCTLALLPAWGVPRGARRQAGWAPGGSRGQGEDGIANSTAAARAAAERCCNRTTPPQLALVLQAKRLVLDDLLLLLLLGLVLLPRRGGVQGQRPDRGAGQRRRRRRRARGGVVGRALRVIKLPVSFAAGRRRRRGGMRPWGAQSCSPPRRWPSWAPWCLDATAGCRHDVQGAPRRFRACCTRLGDGRRARGPLTHQGQCSSDGRSLPRPRERGQAPPSLRSVLPTLQLQISMRPGLQHASRDPPPRHGSAQAESGAPWGRFDRVASGGPCVHALQHSVGRRPGSAASLRGEHDQGTA